VLVIPVAKEICLPCTGCKVTLSTILSACLNAGTVRPESSWGNSDVLMIDCLSIVETDKVIHTVDTDIVKLMVEIESFGMSSDEFDKETMSSDGLQPKQVDLSCIHALNELHLHEICVVLMTDTFHDKLNDDWFNGTNEEEDDLEGIIDYLEPKSYNRFIDLDDEAYNERKSKFLGISYRKPSPILIEKVEVIRYTIGTRETHKKRVIGIDEMPRTRDNIVAIRAGLMKEMANDESGQVKTFSQQGNGIREDMSLLRIRLSRVEILPLSSGV
ncbi:hypothetical protein Tco_1309149, partial [Tanacetum coccineum]